jgi:hypothetical protein
MTLMQLKPTWAYTCKKSYKEDEMNAGQELHKRSNQPANLSNTTHINSTTLAEKVSKVQKVIKKKFAAKLTTQKTCGDMPGSLCVLVIIQKSEKGVDPRTVKQMAGFRRQKVHKILYKLFKHGEIRIDAGGLYAGVKKTSQYPLGGWSNRQHCRGRGRQKHVRSAL